MTTRLRWLAFAGFIASLAAGAVACGETTTTTTYNRCHQVECGEGFVCDTRDGECKCGDVNGPTCKAGEICNAESSVCFSPKCEFSDCKNGESCDPLDGECKCGQNKCQAGEQCVDQVCVSNDLCKGKFCFGGLLCDPEDGLCKCSGVACEPGESCADGECVKDPCAGKNCTINSICSREDGSCHCMGPTGPVCTQGEACIMDTMACVGTNLCDDVVCGAGTACDPADGKCHCGGTYASNSPVCEVGQTCIDGECIGGDLCHDVQCKQDYQCDPKFGLCRCGDASTGPVCDEGAICTAISAKWTCAQPCTLMGSPTGCEANQACIYNVDLKGGLAYCGPKGGKGQDQTCLSAEDCAENFVCLDTGGTARVCKALCEDDDGCTSVQVGAQCIKGGTTADKLPKPFGFCHKLF